jgi:hypothetical protein
MSSAGSDWVAKFGPIYRQNVASTRKQAEEGVMRKLQDAATPMLTVLAPLHEIFLEGAVCPSGCAEPELAEIKPELEVFSYELPNGHWFSQGTASGFGLKLVCKRAGTATP